MNCLNDERNRSSIGKHLSAVARFGKNIRQIGGFFINVVGAGVLLANGVHLLALPV